MTKMRLVPAEPTDEMLEDAGSIDGFDLDCVEDGDEVHREWYQGVISAAPNGGKVNIHQFRMICEVLRPDFCDIRGRHADTLRGMVREDAFYILCILGLEEDDDVNT